MNNELCFKYAAMGGGKSIMLLCQAHSLMEQGFIVLLLKPRIDDRDGFDVIKSRTGLCMECIGIEEDDDICDLVTDNFQYGNISDTLDTPVWLLVDEAQFLTEEQVGQLRFLVDEYEHINVVCYGLKGDFKTNLFPGSKRLFELSDTIEEMVKYCSCGRKATINARLDTDGNVITNGEQVEIGGDERYAAMCTKCYFEKLKN